MVSIAATDLLSMVLQYSSTRRHPSLSIAIGIEPFACHEGMHAWVAKTASARDFRYFKIEVAHSRAPRTQISSYHDAKSNQLQYRDQTVGEQTPLRTETENKTNSKKKCKKQCLSRVSLLLPLPQHHEVQQRRTSTAATAVVTVVTLYSSLCWWIPALQLDSRCHPYHCQRS